MRIVTEEEAKTLICPALSKRGNINQFHCKTKKCFAWEEINPRVERENHSGANEFMNDLRRSRKSSSFQSITKTGCGSTGFLILEAQGTCRKLYKEE